MVLKEVNRVHNAKTRSNGLESSQLGTQRFIVDPIDSFQDHLTSFYHGVPKWLISRPFDWFFYMCIYIIYIYIIYIYMHHMQTYVPLKTCMYTCTIINICVTSTTKNICEDSCTTYTYMHHQEHMSGYMHHIHIHAPHTHTCTAKYHQKIRYA